MMFKIQPYFIVSGCWISKNPSLIWVVTDAVGLAVRTDIHINTSHIRSTGKDPAQYHQIGPRSIDHDHLIGLTAASPDPAQYHQIDPRSIDHDHMIGRTATSPDQVPQRDPEDHGQGQVRHHLLDLKDENQNHQTDHIGGSLGLGHLP